MSKNSRKAINRQNAQKSTGPKSDAGKSVSSQNARKHGLTSTSVFVPIGQEDDFARLREELYRQILPGSPLERILFDQLIAAAWNLRRIAKLQQKLAAQAGVEDPAELLFSENPDHLAQFKNLERYHVRNERTFHRTLNQIKELQTTRALQDTTWKELPTATPPLANATKVLAAKRSQKTPPEGSLRSGVPSHDVVQAFSLPGDSSPATGK